MNQLIQLKMFRTFVVIALPVVWFALSPRMLAKALGPPSGNTFDGYQALFNITTGVHNTAFGFQALFSDTIGSNNTATGWTALFNNGFGYNNTATGAGALYRNTNGPDNTALGASALYKNTIGDANTAVGAGALYNNGEDEEGADGRANTAIGKDAMRSNTIGVGNTAIGFLALYNNNVGDGNIAVGSGASSNLTSGQYNIDIGNPGGVASESSTIRIGTSQYATYIAGIRGIATGIDDAIPVVIDSAGQLGTTSSSRRFKTDIKPMDKASEAVLALKPVTFHYKNQKSNASSRPQFGLIAEDVAKVNPDLIVRDTKGELYTVRYEAVNAMLLNEFLKEHRKVEKLTNDFQATVAQQRKEIQALAATVKEQAAQIQKVSAQLEASKPAPQMVLNGQ